MLSLLLEICDSSIPTEYIYNREIKRSGRIVETNDFIVPHNQDFIHRNFLQVGIMLKDLRKGVALQWEIKNLEIMQISLVDR